MTDVDTRQTWYFSFGFGQPNEGKYYVVREATYEEARERMNQIFNRVWGFQYSEAEWLDEHGVSQAERYNLKEIK